MNIKKVMSERLRELLTENQISVCELSAKIDIPLGVAVGVANGVTMPKVNTLCRIADYLGVSIDYLSGRSDKYWL